MSQFSGALIQKYVLICHGFSTRKNEQGQATAEYVLVLLMAAVVAWICVQMFGDKGSENPIMSLVGSLLDGLGSVAGKIFSFFG